MPYPISGYPAGTLESAGERRDSGLRRELVVSPLQDRVRPGEVSARALARSRQPLSCAFEERAEKRG